MNGQRDLHPKERWLVAGVLAAAQKEAEVRALKRAFRPELHYFAVKLANGAYRMARREKALAYHVVYTAIAGSAGCNCSHCRRKKGTRR